MSDDGPKSTEQAGGEGESRALEDPVPEHLAGLPGLPGLGDLFARFEQAQERFDSAAADASATVLAGRAGNGGVTIEVTGDLEAQSVHIDPALVDPDDVALLEDLVLAALRDVLAQVADLQGDVAGSMAPLGIDLSGVSGLIGDLGGGGAEGMLGRLSDVFGGLGLGALREEKATEPGSDETPGSDEGDRHGAEDRPS